MDRHPQYFEGTLQLRNPTQKIINFVAENIEKKDNVWIAKTVKQKKGIDLYISSNKFLKEIGKKLKNTFTGELIESNKLYSRNRLTSKEIHRGCVCFRHYDFKKGDNMKYKGDDVEVISIGKDILARDISTKKKVHIKWSELDH